MLPSIGLRVEKMRPGANDVRLLETPIDTTRRPILGNNKCVFLENEPLIKMRAQVPMAFRNTHIHNTQAYTR